MYSAVVVDITPRAAKTRAMTFNVMMATTYRAYVLHTPWNSLDVPRCCGYRLDIRK